MTEPNWGRGRNPWNISTQLANSNEPDPRPNNTGNNITETYTNAGIITLVTPEPFYDLFRDTLQTQKTPNTFQVALQNFGGWPQWSSNNNKKAYACAVLTANLMTLSPQRIMLHGTESWPPSTYQNELKVGGKHVISTLPTTPLTPMPSHTNLVE